MSFTLSPNMNLPIPGVGTEAGPTYAFDLNSCMTLIDMHTHQAGSGVQITPDGININISLPFNNNFATELAGLTLQPQTIIPSAIGTLYESGVDLYYIDGLGNNVRITESGGVVGSPGSISNLTSPASASYVSGSSTFVWQSNVNIAANMDFGAATFRNLSPNSTFGITVEAPAVLSSNYNIILPALPGSTSFVTLDSSGNLAAPAVFPLTGANIAANTITGSNMVNGTVTGTQIVANVNLGGVTVQEQGRNLVVSNTNTASSLAIVRFSANSSAVGINGEGVSACTQTSTGVYLITFSHVFADNPVVCATSSDPDVTTQIVSFSNSQCTIATAVFATPTSAGFNMIAIGQRTNP